MLKLKDITKVYETQDLKVNALNGINLEFRKSEFVSILGPSGCGKTTLLNIVGGLDRYTSGDLIISNKSTKDFNDSDWDTYRNHKVGFVFQSYNLIPHQTVLENVEIALTLSGVGKKERRQKAIDVLEKVGLKDKIKNKPNQLSGGQMQRVAIARALVNDPEIILADEPTGALDSTTSVQIMEILKEISNDKLIIMVTHNPELANKYSTRIVKLLDGNLVDDTNPYVSENIETNIEDIQKENKEKFLSKQEIKAKKKEEKKKKREFNRENKKKKMSFFTALALSFKNLLTKKTRTLLVSFAGSIGIIGIALILAVSSGFSTYITKMQEDTLSTYPITIQAKNIDFSSIVMSMFMNNNLSENVTHDKDGVYDKDSFSEMMSNMGNNLNANNLKKFYQHINDNKEELNNYINAVQVTYNMNLEFYTGNQINNITEINNVQPNSNALMQMIIKYALFFFEDKTNAVAEKEIINNIFTGNYIISKPQNGEIDYTFIRQYEDLAYLETELEANGSIKLNSTQIAGLAFTMLGFEGMGSGSGLNSAMRMLGNMDIFYEMIDNDELIESQYNVLAGRYANNANEAILVLDKNNEVDEYVLYALGLMPESEMDRLLEGHVKGNQIDVKIEYEDILNTEYKILTESDYYVEDNGNIVNFKTFNDTSDMTKYAKYIEYYKNALNNTTNKVKIVGIVRLDDKSDTGSLSTGIAYRNSLTSQMISHHNTSVATTGNILEPIDELTPETISIYVNKFESKEFVQKFINDYNETAEQGDEISYTDYVGMIMSTVSIIINAITYVLVAFVGVSLVVSSIMIGIITYISVLERTKEIGILRSVGASKKDIKRVFTAESFIIGLSSGVFGILISLLLIIPINIVLQHFTGLIGMASLSVIPAIILILISIALTLVAGLIPSRLAAKKDPVIALRSN
ncbi:MAG: ABC transporter ATP-binding protein/permease [Clostridiales bacterium]|nr:ABC transporter ATP-binding protein/permease [Clostridiales bacterium]